MQETEIEQYPSPVLLTRCKELAADDIELAKTIITALHMALVSVTWGRPAGMAANQIGHDKRIFIALGKEYINPVVTWRTRAPKAASHEGCYSLPANEYFDIERSPSVSLQWLDKDWNVCTGRFNGREAFVIQHELDHLDGVMCNKPSRSGSGN